MPRNTRLAGHNLAHEGRLAFDADGVKVWHNAYPAPTELGLHARCSCGVVSPVDVTTANQARKWHAGHKDEMRAGVSS